MPDEPLAAVLSQLAKSTGVSFDPSDFTRRLRIQKSIYLLKALRYGPVSKYSFGSYVRGPYSRQLANDYYAIPPNAVSKTAPADVPTGYLGPVVYAVGKGNDFLEAAATLHIYSIRNRTQKKPEVLAYVKGLKPDLARYLEEAWGFLIQNGLLAGPT